MPEQQGQRQIQNEEVADLMKFVSKFLQEMEGSKINQYSINGFWIEANQHFLKLEDTISDLKKDKNSKK